MALVHESIAPICARASYGPRRAIPLVILHDMGGESVCQWGPYVSSLHRARYRGNPYGTGCDVEKVKCLRDEMRGLSIPASSGTTY